MENIAATGLISEKKENWFYANRYVIAAFFCTAIIMTITYILRHVYPFGDQIVLKVDLYHQYAPFHEELRHRIFNGQSLLYSWEGGLGKEFVTQMAYYTASPISFLILLFPQSILLFILFKGAFQKERHFYTCFRSSLCLHSLYDRLLLECHVAGFRCAFPHSCARR